MSNSAAQLMSIISCLGIHMTAKQNQDVSDAIAEIESLRAELAAEREKATTARTEAECLAASCKAVTEQLAASQLSEQRLREALETAKPYMDQSIERLHAALAGYKPHVHKQADDDAVQVDAALSTPTDTAALEAYVAEKVEPWKKDAERYRHLRDYLVLLRLNIDDPENAYVEIDFGEFGITDLPPEIKTVDDAIDAAIAAQEPKA